MSSQSDMDIETILHVMTTPLKIKFNLDNHEYNNASGFFYYEESSKESTTVAKEIWLITNRHVIFENYIDTNLMKQLNFYQRKFSENHVSWNEITLDAMEIKKRTKIHNYVDIDICAIKITDYIKNDLPEENSLYEYSNFFAVSDLLLPEHINFPIHSGDNVILVGYPYGYYDEENLFPIIKSSIISSKWNTKFNNFPSFIIDKDMVVGSSGSIVLTKPTNILVIDGKLNLFPSKQFAFLGIYSESVHSGSFKNSGFIGGGKPNLGMVWYGNIIKDIIDNGKSVE